MTPENWRDVAFMVHVGGMVGLVFAFAHLLFITYLWPVIERKVDMVKRMMYERWNQRSE